jgi:SAM-dependent methyltransferase
MTERIDPKSYWEERLTQNFNVRGVGDIGLPETYNNFLYRIRGHVFRRAVKVSGIKSGSANVVDVGSGTGFYIKQWLDVGVSQLTGLDLTHVAVDRLRAHFSNIEFREIDIGENDVSLAKGAFDCVSSFDVLFHIVEDLRFQSALKNIASVLKPDGVFLYSDNLIQTAFNVTHQVGRTEQSILEALAAAGFVVEHRIPMFVLMNDPVRSRSRVHRKFFSTVYRLACRSATAGAIVGALLYFPELLLTRFSDIRPSTEVLICRKAAAPAATAARKP